MTEQKKPARKKQPSYKVVTHNTDMGSLSDAFSAIEELASECREVYDNMEGGNLGHTQRAQSFDNTASTLECISEIDVPECISDLAFTHAEMVPTRKGRDASRDARRSNIVSILEAARDAANDRAESLRDGSEEADDPDAEDEAQEIDSFVDELDSVIDELEGCEFPGMFG